ncbi:MAG: hypothetical protein Q8J76_05060, partial [Desulfobulbaceae bacterium]|nr:hypothetical protein [Desulfobulbaceae bacterium]
MARVLILDGHCSAALAFVRSLGRAGHTVIVGAEERFFSPAMYSKYCHKRYAYHSPVEGVQKFLVTIQNIVDDERVDVVFPMTDITVWPLSFWRERFSPLRIAVPLHDSIELVSDKFKTIELAERLGVPVP